MMSLKTRSNSETPSLVGLHANISSFAFNFLLLYAHRELVDHNLCDSCSLNNVDFFLSLCLFLAKRSMLLNMTSGSLEAFGGEVSRAEL